MMRKQLLTLASILMLFSWVTQALTVTYPTKSALKKADHIASLVMTGAGVSSYLLRECNGLCEMLIIIFLAATGTNVIINSMALKHEKLPAALLKLVLPTAIMCESLGIFNDIKKEALRRALLVSVGGNMLKNIWDVYSLAQSQLDENTTHSNEVLAS